MKEAFSCEATLTVPLCAAISGESQVQSEHSLYLRDVLRQQLRANGSSLLHLPQHGPGPKGSNVVFQFMCVHVTTIPSLGRVLFRTGWLYMAIRCHHSPYKDFPQLVLLGPAFPKTHFSHMISLLHTISHPSTWESQPTGERTLWGPLPPSSKRKEKEPKAENGLQ